MINDFISIIQDYPKIQQIQNHLYKQMSQEDSHNILINKLSIKSDDNYLFYQDIMKWIYISLVQDVIWQYVNTGIQKHNREKLKERNELRTQSQNYIKKLQNNMIHTIKKDDLSKYESLLQTLSEMNELEINEPEEYDEIKELNFLLSHKIRTNLTGIKITSLKYIYLILQLTLQKEKPKGLYTLSLYVLQEIYRGIFTEDELDIESVHKYLNNINPKNSSQIYLWSFFNMYKTLEEKEQFEQAHQQNKEEFNNYDSFKHNFIYTKDNYDFIHAAKGMLDKKEDDIDFDIDSYYNQWKQNNIAYQIYYQFIQDQCILVSQQEHLQQYL